MATPFGNDTFKQIAALPANAYQPPQQQQRSPQSNVSAAGGLTPEYLDQMRRRSNRTKAAMTDEEKRRKQDFGDFPEEQQSSTIANIGYGLLSGAEKIANVFDVLDGGSSVRDTIGLATTGNLDKYNPIDQIAPNKWTTFEDRVEMRDIFRDKGLASEEDTWGNFGVGLAADIATAPSTYWSFGLAPIIKGGLKVARSVAGKGVRKVAASGSKFSPTAASIQKKGFAKTAEDLPYVGGIAKATNTATEITRKATRALFDSDGKGAIGDDGFELAKNQTKGTETIRAEANAFGRKLGKLLKDENIDIDHHGTVNEVYRLIEDPAMRDVPTTHLKSSARTPYDFHGVDEVTGEKFNKLEGTQFNNDKGKTFLREVTLANRELLDYAQRAGMQIEDLREFGYLSRRSVPVELKGAFQSGGKSALDMRANAQLARDDFYGFGDTELVNRISSDDKFVSRLTKFTDDLDARITAGEVIDRTDAIRRETNRMAIELESKYGYAGRDEIGRAGLSKNLTLETKEMAETYSKMETELDHMNRSPQQYSSEVRKKLASKMGDLQTKMIDKNHKKLQDVAKWIGELDPGYVKIGGFFNQNPLKVAIDNKIMMETATNAINITAASVAGMALKTADEYAEELVQIPRKIAELEEAAASGKLSPEDLLANTDSVAELKRLKAASGRSYEEFTKRSDRNTTSLEFLAGGSNIPGQSSKGLGLNTDKFLLNIARSRAKELVKSGREVDISKLDQSVVLDDMLESLDELADTLDVENIGDVSRMGNLENHIDNVLPEMITKARLGDNIELHEMLSAKLGVAKAELKEHIKHLGKARVPTEYANDVLRVSNATNGVSELSEFWKGLHAVNNLWKGTMTGPFLGFHGRNRASGEGQNLLMGVYGRGYNIPKKLKEMYTQNVNTTRMLKGDDIVKAKDWGIFQGIDGPIYKTDREATDALIELALDHDVIGSGNLQDIATGSSNRAGDLQGILDGTNPRPQRNMFASSKDFRAAIWNYLDLTKRERSGTLDFRMGQNLGDITEVMNRMPGFLSMLQRAGRKKLPKAEMDELIKNGFKGKELAKEVTIRENVLPENAGKATEGMATSAAQEAALRMKLVQVDYSKLTPWEKDYVRLVFPFYSFAKGITKAVGSELYNHPGGGLRQSIRAEAAGSRQDDEDIREGNIIPEYMRRGGMVNLGTDEAGNMSAITSLGLMHNSVSDMAGNVGAQGLGMLSPALKFGIERATGDSLFFDKPLAQLDPPIGRLMSNVTSLATGRSSEDTPHPNAFISPGVEHFISSSPLSRLIGTANKATDTRKNFMEKFVNLSSGLKYSTVSPEDRVRAAQNATNEEIKRRGGRVFEVVNFRGKTTEAQDTIPAFNRSLKHKMKQYKKMNEQGK